MDRTLYTVRGTVLLLCAVTLITPSNAYASNSYKLYKGLFENYTKVLRPVTHENETVFVDVKFLFRGISEFDEIAGQLSVAAAIDLRWNDPKLGWNMSDFRLQALVLPEEHIWTPRLALSNPTDRILLFYEDTFPVRIYFNGNVIWLQGGTIRSTCVPNVEKYPFDVHKCYLVIMALPYTRSEVQLIPKVDLKSFEKFGEWELGNHTVTEELFGGFFSSVIITLDIKRRPEFSLLSTILPILFLGVLNACVFLLPPEQGERVSYTITVLLSFAVFLSIVSTVMPKNSDPVPILCYVVTAMMAMSGLITICTILGHRWYFADPREEVPGWLQMICCKYKRKYGNREELYRNYVAVNNRHSEQFHGRTDSPQSDSAVTWRDVCRTVDILFFWLFLFSFFALVAVYLIIVYPW